MHILVPLWLALQAGYIVMMDWVLIPRWNENIRHAGKRPRLLSSLWHGSLGALFVTATVCRWRWLVFVGGCWFALLLMLAFNNWWIPYLFGHNKGELDTNTFTKEYGNNLRFLPSRNHSVIVPDAQHVVMQGLIAGACVLSFIAWARL